jgi:hypothetical protein
LYSRREKFEKNRQCVIPIATGGDARPTKLMRLPTAAGFEPPGDAFEKRATKFLRRCLNSSR